jgi:2-methylcitrate dehydratase PrpD
MTPLQKMGQFVAGFEAAAIPGEARRAARMQIVDMVAAAHAAGTSKACVAVEAAAVDLAGSGGASTVLATGRKLPPVEAAMVNAAYAMAQDYDDIVWMGHTCHSAVFAPLAVAEHEGSSADALVDAVVLANEVAGRLGATSFFGPLNGQMWSFVHLVGAAAGTARLLGLDAERATHALGIALAQPNFPLQPAFFRPTSKLLTASTPTATGIRAAYLARAGLTGASEILEDRRGFWSRFSFQPLPEMIDDLGEFWAMQTLSIKTYPGCFFFQTTCRALDNVLARRPAEHVVAVDIDTTKLGTEVTRFARDYAPADDVSSVNACFDLGWCAAILLHAGRLTAAEHHEDWLAEHADAIRTCRRKITVRHDPRLTARVLTSASAIHSGGRALRALRARDVAHLVSRYRQEYRSSLITAAEVRGWLSAWRHPPTAPVAQGSSVGLAFPGRVTVTYVDGTKETEQVDVPPGAFCEPGALDQLRSKFLREAGPRLADAEAALAAGLGLGLGEGSVGAFVTANTFEDMASDTG